VLVRFDSKAGTRMMGQSGAVPGAILSQDIPSALQRLRQAIGQNPGAGTQTQTDDEEPQVNISQRAFPLIELLERAAKSGADVIWEEEGKRFTT
jgi:hypothetical protein